MATLFAQANPTGVSGYSSTTATNDCFGIYFTVAAASTLSDIWFYSPSGSSQLPSVVSLYEYLTDTTGTLLVQNTSPSWSGAAGSGWVSCSLSYTTLATGTMYVATYFCANSGSTGRAQIYTGSNPAGWFPATSSDSNITAPEFATTGVANGPYLNGADAYPSSFIGDNINWLIDVQITPNGGSAGNVSGVTASVTVAGESGTPAGAANVAGSTGNVVVAGVAGVPAGAANVPGAAGSVTVAGVAGAPAGAASVSGAAGSVVVAGLAGTPGGAASVAGVTANVAVASLPGIPAGGGAGNVAGVVSNVVVASLAGTPSGAGPALVTGPLSAYATVANALAAEAAISNALAAQAIVSNALEATATWQ